MLQPGLSLLCPGLQSSSYETGLIATLPASEGYWGEELRSGLRTSLGKDNQVKVWGLPVATYSSSPQGHPFIVQFNDGNATVVSMWVCRVLEERRSQQGPP